MNNIKDKIVNLIQNKWVVSLMLLMIFVVATLPAFRNAVYEGHDLKFHLGRIQSIGEALKANEIPVRYEQNAWYGHGYVSSLFYGNIFLYFPAILFNLGMPLYRAYNIYVIVTGFSTVLIAYYSFSRLLDDRVLGVLATVLYVLSGYRLSNMFVRAAVGEYTAMAFVPLCVYGFYRIYREKEHSILNQVLPFVLGVSGLIQSHILMTEMVGMFLILFAVLQYRLTIAVIKPLLISLACILGINAFFLVPFLMSYSSMELMATTMVATGDDLKGNGLYLSQLFGLITEGKGYNSTWSAEHEGCYNVGMLIIICEIIAFINVIVLLIKRIKSQNITPSEPQENRAWILIATFMGALAMWLSSIYFPWQIFKGNSFISKLFTTVQYPWRYQSILVICFVIAAVSVVKCVVKDGLKRIVILIVISAIALINTAIFDYQLSFSLNRYDEIAAVDWADKLYLPVGTDIKKLEGKSIVYGEDEIILPVLAYDNVAVLDENGQKIVSWAGDNNCIAIPSDVDTANITVKYLEPILWRVSEMVSLITILFLIAIWIKEGQKNNI